MLTDSLVAFKVKSQLMNFSSVFSFKICFLAFLGLCALVVAFCIPQINEEIEQKI